MEYPREVRAILELTLTLLESDNEFEPTLGQKLRNLFNENSLSDEDAIALALDEVVDTWEKSSE